MRATAILFLSFLVLGCAQSNVVQTQSGMLEGAVSDEYETVAVYKGIPYAKPPVEELRWVPPQPADAWEGVRPATDFASECMQTPVEEGLYTTAPASTSEDCLYLNVWTPTDANEANLPVMVWIHGGAFIMGSGSSPGYNGASLANRGAVVVTINYRLGIFGFFAHPALSAESPNNVSGNQGLYDQIAALQWVQDNIANFGGDPSNVTIFGESAGSMSVCYLVSSPLANGLFQKAIGQSGACFAEHRALDTDINEIEPFTMPGTPAVVGSGHEIGLEVASALGVTGTGPEALAKLRELNELSIFETLREADVNPHWRSIFVDGHLFPDQMHSLVESGQSNPVDVIVGSTRDEGTALFTFFQDISVEDWERDLISNLGETSASKLMAVYGEDASISTRTTSQELMSDQLFAWEMRTWARINTALGRNAYVYVFNHAPVLPEYGESLGAFHGSEIAYIFGTGSLMFAAEVESSDDVEATTAEFWRAEDDQVLETIQQYWFNFAATGDPNGDDLPDWPVYDVSTDQTLEIKLQSAPMKNYRGAKLDVWDEIMTAAKTELDSSEEQSDAEGET